jgi:hypothetical protein
MTFIRSFFFLAPLLFLSNLALGDEVETSLGTPSPISAETTIFIVEFSSSANFKRDEGNSVCPTSFLGDSRGG